MLVRFYSIEWDEESAELPASVTIDVDFEDENEVEMNGSDILEEEFGVAVSSFEWELADEDDDEDAFPDQED
jgi:hypothetical protein